MQPSPLTVRQYGHSKKFCRDGLGIGERTCQMKMCFAVNANYLSHIPLVTTVIHTTKIQSYVSCS